MDKIKRNILIFKDLTFTDACDFCILAAMIYGMLFSIAILSFALVFMLLRILFIGKISLKWQKIKENKVILGVFAGFFMLHVIGLLWTQNLELGGKELLRDIVFVIVPIFLCAVSPMKKNMLKILFLFYLCAILSGTIWGMTTYLSQEFPDVRNLIPHASNIRFAVNICLLIALIALIISKYRQNKKVFWLILIIFWLIFYMIITQAMTGICILCVLSVATLIYVVFKKRSPLTWTLSGVLVLIMLIFTFWVFKETKNYFSPQSIDKQPLTANTINGNPYTHDRSNFIENGHYVNNYVCKKELKTAWKMRTGLNINDLSNGAEGRFRYRDVLVRYLNSKGLTKDSVGIMSLNINDINNIKNGFSNVVYTEKFSLRPRLYKTFFEFERYIHAGYVKDYSLIKRIELCKNAIKVFQNHPIIGVGTGDVKETLFAALATHKYRDSFDNHDPHNYFFYIAVEFGVLGLIVLIFFLIYPPIRQKVWSNPLFFYFFIINICAMLIESSFHLHAGMVFFCLFSCIIFFNNNSIKELI
ncbi:MAG: O-antigen ligase family protein [Bacteroidales bacterium]|jgi:hypothetical protein|nr:O-antigen ligase family protein [Bacteroidales bacterium]